MESFTPQEIAAKKKAIFDAMGKRGQKQIMRIGYEKWDPIQTPKDPIDIRRDKSKRTTQQLVSEFLQQSGEEGYSSAFSQGALEMALGVVNEEEKVRGMFAFAVWYENLMKREGVKS